MRPGRTWTAASPRASELILEEFHPARLQARVHLAEPRLLASSIYQDGGWIVLRDGEPQPAVLANGPFVAAWLPAGDAEVDFLYRPKGFLAGMLLAALALGAAAALWVRAPTRSAARPRS